MIVVILTGFLVAALWMGLIGLGAVLLWRGFRGRATDCHPHCRRCGYALVGELRLPPRCPECGLVLDGPRNWRSSPRERRWSLVAAGALTIVALLAPLGLLYWPGLVGPSTAAAAPKQAAAAPNPPAAAPVPPGAARVVVIPYLRETPTVRAEALPWAVRPDPAGREGPPAQVNEPEVAEEPREEPVPWRHLRNINGCCPSCGSPVVTPNRVALCRKCGADLAK